MRTKESISSHFQRHYEKYPVLFKSIAFMRVLHLKYQDQLKFIALIISAYLVYRYGHSVREFIYQITH